MLSHLWNTNKFEILKFKISFQFFPLAMDCECDAFPASLAADEAATSLSLLLWRHGWLAVDVPSCLYLMKQLPLWVRNKRRALPCFSGMYHWWSLELIIVLNFRVEEILQSDPYHHPLISVDIKKKQDSLLSCTIIQWTLVK